VIQRDGDMLTLFCPACQETHQVHDGSDGWVWDGNTETPTLSPSIKVTGVQWPIGSGFHKPLHWKVAAGDETVCHSYVIRGEWQYLADSTHALAGQTVPCVPLEPTP
jgi:hypothetical protein